MTNIQINKLTFVINLNLANGYWSDVQFLPFLLKLIS